MTNDPAWTIGWEPRPWVPDVTAYSSRRQQREAHGRDQAAVPSVIAAADLRIEPAIEAESAEAAAAIARFDARTAALLPARRTRDSMPLAAVLLRTESVSSSQIEHITAGAKALALASIDERVGPNARLIAQNVNAMRLAVSTTAPIDASTVLGMHTVLLEHEGHDWVGRWRTHQVWIGGRGSSPHTASFVPPHHDRVPEAMEDLFAFCARADVAPFTQAAVAHAQFETIHPFPDGNGRVGRAMVHTMLRQADVTRSTVVPVSAGLLGDTEAYFEALTAYREGDVGLIVRRFCEAAFDALRNGEQLVQDLTEMRAGWDDRVAARRDSVVWPLLDHLIRLPAVTVKHVQEEFSISQPAAQRAIDVLVGAEVVEAASANKRNRVWVCDQVTSAMDAFGERATTVRLGPVRLGSAGTRLGATI